MIKNIDVTQSSFKKAVSRCAHTLTPRMETKHNPRLHLLDQLSNVIEGKDFGGVGIFSEIKLNHMMII